MPLATGVSEYDTNQLLENLPGDLKVIDREPCVSVNSDEIFFIWRCHKKTVNALVKNFASEQ